MVCYTSSLSVRPGADIAPETVISLAEPRLLWLGEEVLVKSASARPSVKGETLRGRLVGLDPAGALLLENLEGRFAVWSGSLYSGAKISL
jgi:hypothetical protein